MLCADIYEYQGQNLKFEEIRVFSCAHLQADVHARDDADAPGLRSERRHRRGTR
jgi:hypothetical protein